MSDSRTAGADAGMPLRFTWQELSGSLGDLGTLLPLVLAMCLTCGFDLGAVLIWAGVLNVLTGWWLRQPIPVQPMKAIAAVAITERLCRDELAAGGILLGVVLVILSVSGAVTWAARHVPKPVVRGIQLGVGLKLAQTGFEWLTGLRLSTAGLALGAGLPWLGWDSLLVAGVFAAALLLGGSRARPRLWPRSVPILLLFFLVGLILLFAARPDVYRTLHFAWPRLSLTCPAQVDAWRTGLWNVAVPQFPLTLLNSVVAVCALSADYFPGRGIPPRRMALSVGLMNLVSVPLGGIPMCHGAGGLAAQYRFGARTGGSVIMLGGLKIAAGLAFGASLAPLLASYPRSILAIMLVFAGASLAAPARDCMRGTALLVLLATAAAILATNAALGVTVGVLIALAVYRGFRPASSPRPVS